MMYSIDVSKRYYLGRKNATTGLGCKSRLLHNCRNRDRVCSTSLRGRPRKRRAQDPGPPRLPCWEWSASSQRAGLSRTPVAQHLTHWDMILHPCCPTHRDERSRKPSGRSRHQADIWGSTCVSVPAADTRPHWWDSFSLTCHLTVDGSFFKKKRKRTSLKIVILNKHLKASWRSRFHTDIMPFRFQASCWSSKVNSCLPQSPFPGWREFCPLHVF